MQDLKIKIYHPLARRIIESEEIVDLHFSLGKVQSASILLDNNESPELYDGSYCYLFNLDNIKIIGSALNLGRKES